MARGFQLGLPFLGGLAIQDMAVRVHYARHVIRALCAPLDLHAVHARCGELVQMREHIHVVRAHDEAASVVLDHGEILAGARFLHKRILPAARLRAVAHIGAATGQVVAD